MFKFNRNVFLERSLLRKCAQKDPRAEAAFDHLSYKKQVYRTVHETNLHFNRVLSDAEVRTLSELLITNIFEAHHVLPHWRQNLYRRVHAYAYTATVQYIKMGKC